MHATAIFYLANENVTTSKHTIWQMPVQYARQGCQHLKHSSQLPYIILLQIENIFKQNSSHSLAMITVELDENVACDLSEETD